MRKLAEVEEARRLMTEGQDWSVWRWLMEKKRMREAADAASAALERAEKKVKAAWPPGLKKADTAAVKQADEQAYEARMAAEAAFDEAERRMSASLAREGARKALDTYDLHERAIRKAEALARRHAERFR